MLSRLVMAHPEGEELCAGVSSPREPQLFPCVIQVRDMQTQRTLRN
jgi:hypothetical protein